MVKKELTSGRLSYSSEVDKRKKPSKQKLVQPTHVLGISCLPVYSQKWQRKRVWLYDLLECPEKSKLGTQFSCVMMGVICISILAFILETDEEIAEFVGAKNWEMLEVVCTMAFTIEYALRWTVCDVYGDSAIAFVFAPMNLCDLAAIVPFYIKLALQSTNFGAARVLRVVRLTRVLRLFKAAKSNRGMRIMGEGLQRSCQPLILLLALMVLCLIFFSALMYYAERPSDPGGNYGSAPATFWWTIVTLTTVGYGDAVPTTSLGRFLAMCTMTVGILAIALPMSIVGNQFQEVYAMIEKEQREAQSTAAADSVATARKTLQNAAKTRQSLASQLPQELEIAECGEVGFNLPGSIGEDVVVETSTTVEFKAGRGASRVNAPTDLPPAIPGSVDPPRMTLRERIHVLTRKVDELEELNAQSVEVMKTAVDTFRSLRVGAKPAWLLFNSTLPSKPKPKPKPKAKAMRPEADMCWEAPVAPAPEPDTGGAGGTGGTPGDGDGGGTGADAY